LNGLLVTAQNATPIGLAQITSFDVQQQIDFPRPKTIAIQIASKQFLNQTVELYQEHLGVYCRFRHELPGSYRQLLGKNAKPGLRRSRR
jgi:hypothetical protein